MTRLMSAILAFYLTLGLVQIPFVQDIMPGYVKEILAATPDEEETPEVYYVSIVVPGTNFDPRETEQEIYSKNLKQISYTTIDQMLKHLPGVTQDSRDSYTLKSNGLELPVSLYMDKTGDMVTEIEFQIPNENRDQADKVVATMAQLAAQIPNSKFFDYTGQRLYLLKDKEALVQAIQTSQSENSQSDASPSGTESR